MAITTRSAFYYGHNITENNQYINFSEDGGVTELSTTIPVGAYTLTDFTSEVVKALNAEGDNTYTISLDRLTRKITINCDANFDLLVTTGTQSEISAFSLIGFTSNKSGSNSFESDTGSGFAYYPQYNLQNYVDFQDILESVDSSVNTSASGLVEVINFGRVNFMECNIKYATDIIGQGAIDNNANGVSDLRQFMTYITNKYPLEFVKDKDAVNFNSCILERSAKSKDGTSFQLYELYSQGLAYYYETKTLVFREL